MHVTRKKEGDTVRGWIELSREFRHDPSAPGLQSVIFGRKQTLRKERIKSLINTELATIDPERADDFVADIVM